MQIIEAEIMGSNAKPITMDICFKSNNTLKPIIIFCHGFKGFKNWGHFDLIAQTMAKHDFVFIKFNFSYNGTTSLDKCDFADLDAFGKNNFTTELNDLGLVINYAEQQATIFEGKASEIYLIGHSRGGGICILKAFEDKRIKKLISWASVKDVADFFVNQDLQQWKNNKFIYTYNSRTKQNMPLHYQIYEDFKTHEARLDIPKAAAGIKIPWLIVHGTNDTSVPLESAKYLHNQQKNSILFSIEKADHTFGGKHPWNSTELPVDSKILVEKTIHFLNTTN